MVQWITACDGSVDVTRHKYSKLLLSAIRANTSLWNGRFVLSKAITNTPSVRSGESNSKHENYNVKKAHQLFRIVKSLSGICFRSYRSAVLHAMKDLPRL